MPDEIRFVGDMERLAVRPGDIYVLSCERPISQETAQHLRTHLKAALGSDAKVLILDAGLALGVVGEDAIPAAAVVQ